MNKHIVKGKAKQIVGAGQQKAGELLNDRSTQAKGAAKRVEGQLQETAGRLKDAAERDIRH